MAVTTKNLLNDIKGAEDIAKTFIGQKIAVLCSRYLYRGILLGITQGYIVLANTRSVEISGPSANEKPEREDDIDGPVLIGLSSVELVYQPNWVNAPLTKEEETFALLKAE